MVRNARISGDSVALFGRHASWRARVTVAVALVASFWFVGHSFNYSKTMAAESAISADRVENRFAEQQAETTTSSAIGYFVLGGLGVACALNADGPRLRLKPVLAGLCALYVAWCVVSILWSIEPTQTFRKLAILGLMLLGAFGMAQRFSLEDVVWIAVLTLGGFVAIGVVAEILSGTFRPWRADYRFAGTCHPNDQGLQCALLALAAWLTASEGSDRPWLRRMLIGVALVGLALSKSRTTLAALVFAGAIALVLRARGSQRWLVLCGCLTCIALVGMGASFVSVSALDQTADVASMGRRENVTSLTGRLPLWHELWKAAEERMGIGHGFGAFWGEKNVLRYSEIFSWHIPHGHNAYLDLVLAVGVVGAVLYLLWVTAAALAAAALHEREGRPAQVFAVCLAAFSLVHGLTESKFPGAGIGGFMLVAAIACVSTVEHPAATPELAGRAPLPRADRAGSRRRRRLAPLRTEGYGGAT